MIQGTPIHLDDGTWGARVTADDPPQVGDRIEIQGRNGTWMATIAQVVEGYRCVYLCRVRR